MAHLTFSLPVQLFCEWSESLFQLVQNPADSWEGYQIEFVHLELAEPNAKLQWRKTGYYEWCHPGEQEANA